MVMTPNLEINTLPSISVGGGRKEGDDRAG